MRLPFTACMAAVVLFGCSGQKTENPSEDTMAANSDAELQITVPSGHPLLVQLRGELSTEQNTAGDTFTGVLLKPLTVENREVVPSGSLVTGRIDYLSPPAEGHPATMSLSIVDVGGDPAHTSLLNLEASSTAAEEGPAAEAGAGLGILDAGKQATTTELGTVTETVIAVTADDGHVRLQNGQKMRFEFTESYVTSRKTA